jgi:hypothetical protein
VTSGDWTHLLVFGAAVVSTLATAIVAGVVATKVVDRWRPSPPVPDGVADHRSWLTFPYIFAILCYATIKPTAGFPGASGLYVVSDQSWLRVEAPADLAYEVIATLAIFTIGYAAGIVIKWGWGLYAASLAASKAEAQAERAAAKLAKANQARTGQ